MSTKSAEITKEIYLKHLEEYCYREAVGKLPLPLFEQQYNKKLLFEKIFQDISLKKIDRFVDEKLDTNRSIIFGKPGQGKSFFALRVAIASIRKETEFLYRYSNILNESSFPIFISLSKFQNFCNEKFEEYLQTVSKKFFTEKDVANFLYTVSCFMFSKEFEQRVTEEDFVSFFLENKKKCLIIFDGFDEIFSKGAREASTLIINSIKDAKLIITSRPEEKYGLHDVIEDVDWYEIEEMSDEKVILFVERFFTAIYGNGKEQKKYINITKQLYNPYYLNYLSDFYKTPLNLSLVLSVSLANLKLPENKAELYQSYVDIILTRYKSKKNGFSLGNDCADILSYIAFYMTENHLLSIDERELQRVLNECLDTVTLQKNYCFDRFRIHPDGIIEELLRSGLLEKNFGLDEYKFALHRQIQEFFCARSLIKKINLKGDVIDFLCEKSLEYGWEQIIVLFALMTDDEYDVCELVDRLMVLAERDTRVFEVLFLLVYDNAIKIDFVKCKIFSVVFRNSISENQIQRCTDLMQLNNDTSRLLEAYIQEQALASYERKDDWLEFGYAAGMASVAKAALDSSVDPFKKIEDAFSEGNDNEIYLATQFLTVLSWCNYAGANIHPTIRGYIEHKKLIKMSRVCHINVKNIIEKSNDERLLLEVALACRESALFFWDFSDDFLSEEILNLLVYRLNNYGYKRYIAVLLSLFSVERLPKKCLVKKTIKDYILKLFEEDISEDIKDSAIYRFRTALVLGIISKEEVFTYWNRIEEMYHNYNEVSHGPIRNWYKDTAKLMPKEKFLYLNNGDEYRFIYKESSLSEASKEFLEKIDARKVVFSEFQKIEVSICYRRNDFELIYKNSVALTSEEFEQTIETDLSNWLYVFNKALLISKVTSKDFGDLFLGYGVLKLAMFLDPGTCVTEEAVSIKEALRYFSLEHKSSMLEGLILRFWLWEIDNKNDFLDERDEILAFFNKSPSYIESFADFFRVHMDNIIKEFVWRIKSLHEAGLICKLVKIDGYEKEYYYGCTFNDSRKKVYRLLFAEDGSYAFEKEGSFLGESDEAIVIDIFFSNFETFKEMNYIDLRETIFPE